MSIPVRRSAKPRKNAPLWATGVLGLFGAVKAATEGWPEWAVVVVFVGCLAWGIVPQFATKPGDE
jgi:4-hydroxybenzoate polyprenyltransferase